MSRTRVRRRLAVTIAVATVASAWAPALGRAVTSGGHDQPVARSRYVVQRGDTLWSIAAEIAPAEDPRPLVDAIASANAIDAQALVPGQTIVIPRAG